MIYQKIVISFVLSLFILKINAQDIHYSQFYNSPLTINPANAGVFNGDHRFIASIRDQWRFVPVPWFTFSGAYDRKIYLNDNDKLFFGAGAQLNHDRQGSSRINLTSLNLNGSIHYALAKEHIISGGLLLGIDNRGFNTEDLTWDKQWNGDSFDPNSSSGELFSNVETIFFLETGLGMNYRYQKSHRTHVDFGIAGQHLIEPKATFYNTDNTKLPRRWTANVVGNFKLVDRIDFQLHGLHQLQGEYRETIFGGLAKFYLSQSRGKELQIHAGLGYRTTKSYIPTLAIQYNEWYASFSFDVDNTDFNNILTNNKGGPEVHVRYIITNVKPLKTSKVCPIY